MHNSHKGRAILANIGAQPQERCFLLPLDTLTRCSSLDVAENTNRIRSLQTVDISLLKASVHTPTDRHPARYGNLHATHRTGRPRNLATTTTTSIANHPYPFHLPVVYLALARIDSNRDATPPGTQTSKPPTNQPETLSLVQRPSWIGFGRPTS